MNDLNGDGDCAACVRNPEASCRKSAGDALKISLLEIMAPSRARDMVDAYAHELAEKIYQRAEEADVAGQRSFASGAHAAGTWIDPGKRDS